MNYVQNAEQNCWLTIRITWLVSALWKYFHEFFMPCMTSQYISFMEIR